MLKYHSPMIFFTDASFRGIGFELNSANMKTKKNIKTVKTMHFKAEVVMVND